MLIDDCVKMLMPGAILSCQGQNDFFMRTDSQFPVTF